MDLYSVVTVGGVVTAGCDENIKREVSLYSVVTAEGVENIKREALLYTPVRCSYSWRL